MVRLVVVDRGINVDGVHGNGAGVVILQRDRVEGTHRQSPRAIVIGQLELQRDGRRANRFDSGSRMLHAGWI